MVRAGRLISVKSLSDMSPSSKRARAARYVRNGVRGIKGINNMVLLLTLMEHYFTLFLLLHLFSKPIATKLLRSRRHDWSSGFLFRILEAFGLRHVKIKLDGLKIHVTGFEALERAARIVANRYEPEVVKIFELLVGDVIVDVGAHVGYYTLKASRHAKTVISVEPSPENFYWLRRNIIENGLRNVISFNVALSNKPGIIRLLLASESGQHTTIKSAAANRRNCITVKALTLEMLLNDYEAVDLVKVDVEGAEWDVSESARSIINKIKSWIIELRDSKRRKELEDLLASYGYKVYWLDDDHVYAVRKIVKEHFTPKAKEKIRLLLT